MHTSFRAYLTSVVAASALLIGCSAPSAVTIQQDARLDSLYAVNQGLLKELDALRDTVQFYSDIETGQYYRDQRVLRDEIERLEYELSVCRDGGRTFETLQVDDLFEPASATLTDDGRARLAVLADTLKARHTGDVIRVEGHSDSSPVGGTLAEKFPSNWELSAARAAAVVRYLIDEHELPTGQVEVASYGSTRPVVRNDTAAGRRENRRIRIAVKAL